MKKLIPFLVLLLIIPYSAFSQNIVEYDFKTKSLDTIKPIKFGENCVFKVKNINKFIYEVKIKSSQFEFNSEPPDIFSNMLNIEKHETNIVESAVDGVGDKMKNSSISSDLKNLYSMNQVLYDSIDELKLENKESSKKTY